MFIKSLNLKDFRQFSAKKISFDHDICLIVGPNGIGKSSILEAIRMLSSGRSFRATRVEQMIKFSQPLARVKGKVVADELSEGEGLGGLDEMQLSLLLTPGEVQGKRTSKVLYSVNENRRRRKDFVGKLLTVVFRPEDLRLVEGSPGRRRNYLDDVLTATDQYYDNSLTKYAKALTRRNKLLSLIKDGKQKPSALKYWDLTMIKHGESLQETRRKFIEFVNSLVQPPLDMKLIYQPSIITQERLDSHQRGAIGAGYTLIGPHKDDLQIQLRFPQVADEEPYQALELYGSRGQKRLGVLWLKLAELQWLRREAEQEPVLLLDDILSELDDHSRDLVLSLLGRGQCVVTSTEKELEKELSNILHKKMQVVKLNKHTKKG